MDPIIIILAVIFVLVIVCIIVYCIYDNKNSESFTTNYDNMTFKIKIDDSCNNELNKKGELVTKGKGDLFMIDTEKGIITTKGDIVIPKNYIKDIKNGEIILNKMLFGYGPKIYKCGGRLKMSLIMNVPSNEMMNYVTKLYFNESELPLYTCSGKKQNLAQIMIAKLKIFDITANKSDSTSTDIKIISDSRINNKTTTNYATNTKTSSDDIVSSEYLPIKIKGKEITSITQQEIPNNSTKLAVILYK